MYALVVAVAAFMLAAVHAEEPRGPKFGVTSAGGVPRVMVDGQPVAGMCAIPAPAVSPEAVISSMGDLARVMRSPNINFLASPGSYNNRRGGQSGRFQFPYQASCRLHGKLFWDEADIRTYHAKTKAIYRCATLEESIGAIKRNFGYALTGGWELWWFLIAGNDTFHDEALLAPIRTGLAEEKATLLSNPWKPAEVAMFTSTDEYATSRLADRDGAPVSVICKTDFHYRTMPYAGVAYDSYDLADIGDARLPDYKVYVFPNAFTLSEEQRKSPQASRRTLSPMRAVWSILTCRLQTVFPIIRLHWREPSRFVTSPTTSPVSARRMATLASILIGMQRQC